MILIILYDQLTRSCPEAKSYENYGRRVLPRHEMSKAQLALFLRNSCVRFETHERCVPIEESVTYKRVEGVKL